MNTCKHCIHFESGVLDCQDPKDDIDICALDCQPTFPDENCDEFEANAYYENEKERRRKRYEQGMCDDIINEKENKDNGTLDRQKGDQDGE